MESSSWILKKNGLVVTNDTTSVSEEDPLELALSESDVEDEPVFETAVAGKRRNVFRIRGTKQQQEKMSVIYSKLNWQKNIIFLKLQRFK